MFILRRMSKPWKPGRKTVELQPGARPSRIRRDPVRLLDKVEPPTPPSPEREIWVGIAGVVLFAAACAALTVGISEITSHGKADAADSAPQFGHCYNHPGPNCVLDGDTIYVGGQRLEIAGMDAPEIRGARCREEASRGVEAAVRLLALLNSGKVSVAGTGQLPRKVEVGGRDVGAAMIEAGVARKSGGTSPDWCA
jgi:micrococcal nuclease